MVVGAYAHTIDLNHDQWETKIRIIRNEFGSFLDRIAKQDGCVYRMCYISVMDYSTPGDPISGGGAALIDTDSELATAVTSELLRRPGRPGGVLPRAGRAYGLPGRAGRRVILVDDDILIEHLR